MATRTGQSRELTSRGATTRNRIVSAAADLVYARGVAGTSIENIMAASATSKSQIYSHFSSKDALIREVISIQTHHVMTAQMLSFEQLNSAHGLKLWCDLILEANGKTGNGRCPLGSLANELSSQSETARELLVKSFEVWEAFLANVL